jgi:toxin ParE1/3/4
MKVVFTPAARRDILTQAVYLAVEAFPSVAERFIDAVQRTARWISRNPHLGSPIYSAHPKLQGLRRWPVKGFEVVSIYYQEHSAYIRLVRILHSKRNVRRLLSLLRD